MITRISAAFGLVATLLPARPAPAAYPPAPTADVTETHHGIAVADPYRPLEDPDSPASRAWIEAQNKLTFEFLESVPARDAIKRRLTELWDYEKLRVPFMEGGRTFFARNSGLQN